jgi:hypothetical protein
MTVATWLKLRAARPSLTLAELAALKKMLTRPELDAYAQVLAQGRLN